MPSQPCSNLHLLTDPKHHPCQETTTATHPPAGAASQFSWLCVCSAGTADRTHAPTGRNVTEEHGQPRASGGRGSLEHFKWVTKL